MRPLVSEAMKKAAVAWLTVGERRPCPVWCVWLDNALHVVTRRDCDASERPADESTTLKEQSAPGLESAATVVVTVRGDSGGRILSWPARVTRVAPGSPAWEQVVPQLAGKRLNLPTAEDTAARWAASCVVSRLEPVGEVSEAGDTLPRHSHAAPPAGSPAARRTRKPFRIHKVRGAARP